MVATFGMLDLESEEADLFCHDSLVTNWLCKHLPHQSSQIRVPVQPLVVTVDKTLFRVGTQGQD